MNKRHYEHTLPNIRGSLSNTYRETIGSGNDLIEGNTKTDLQMQFRIKF